LGRFKVNDMKRILLLFLFVFVAGLGCGPKVERTVGKNKSGTEAYLRAHILELYPVNGKASFVTDGELGIDDKGKGWSKEFVLVAGEQFQAQPDHHASSTFEIKAVNSTGVALKYSSKFNHLSFGKNLITIDEGEIELPFKGKK
jgi:hypothetical protein